MAIFGRLFKSRDKPKDRVSQAPAFYMGQSISGKVVNERSSMQTTAVFACVRIIAETVASLPLHTYKYVGDGKEKVYSHPLYKLLHDEPNRDDFLYLKRNHDDPSPFMGKCLLSNH